MDLTSYWRRDISNIGKLGSLPAELRNEIYDLSLATRYRFGKREFWDGFRYRDWFDRQSRPRSMALLLVCRQVNLEVIEILYSRKICRVAVNLFWLPNSSLGPPIAERLMNIELDVHMAGAAGYRDANQVTTWYMERLNSDFILSLAHRQTRGASITIRLWSCDIFTFFTAPKDLFHALRSLTNFKTVIIDVKTVFESKETLFEALHPHDSVKPTSRENSTRATAHHNIISAGLNHYDEEIRLATAWVYKLMAVLEPTLGTARIHKAHDVGFGRCLEFHPEEQHVTWGEGNHEGLGRSMASYVTEALQLIGWDDDRVYRQLGWDNVVAKF